jgi:anaerobic magnesium-protoporphyrin IX monomethyl ester cyclase
MSANKRLMLALVGPPSEYALVTPPLGLLYLAAWLRDKFKLDIRVINQRAERWSSDRLVKAIVDFDPHIVGLGCMTPSAYALPGITEAIRRALPDALMVLGGPHVSALGAEALAATAADAGVVGEGELSMEYIVRALFEGTGMERIPGLIRRSEEGEIVVNPGFSPIIDDVDTLPMPAYDLIDIKKYWRLPSMPPIPHRKYMAIFSSRGCPYGCMYCHNVFGRRFRAHSAERMVEEVKYGVQKLGVDEIEFVDDCFNLDRKRVEQYADLLLREVGAVKTAFPNAIRADLLDADSLDVLTAAGMYHTALALESGTPRVQEFIGKRLNIEKYSTAAALCAERRVFTNGFVMLGFPTETLDEMEETIRVASESHLHIASFFRVTPFPNTPLYEYVRKNNPDKLTAVTYNEMEYWRAKFNVSSVSDEELEKTLGKALRKFYLRPERLYRIARDYPKPFLLPTYALMFLRRVMTGIV